MNWRSNDPRLKRYSNGWRRPSHGSTASRAGATSWPLVNVGRYVAGALQRSRDAPFNSLASRIRPHSPLVTARDDVRGLLVTTGLDLDGRCFPRSVRPVRRRQVGVSRVSTGFALAGFSRASTDFCRRRRFPNAPSGGSGTWPSHRSCRRDRQWTASVLLQSVDLRPVLRGLRLCPQRLPSRLDQEV